MSRTQNDDEGEETSLHVQDLRHNEDIPAVANTSDDYHRFLEWQEKKERDRSCYGYLFYYCFYLPWGVISVMEPLWQAGVIILTSVGVMYSSTLRDGDLFKGMILGASAGALATLILVLLWWLTFHAGAFVDSKSKLRYRNAYHKGTICAYFTVLIMFIVVIMIIIAIDKKCVHQSSPHCDLKCDMSFIPGGLVR